MTGGMQAQQLSTLEINESCRSHGKPVAVGGPDVTSSPHVYASADFRVVGEAESVMDDFIRAWSAGDRADIERQIERIDQGEWQPPELVTAVPIDNRQPAAVAAE